MRASNERLTILSEAEQAALYELPNFDDKQRLNYLNLTPDEQALMHGRSTLACALQIGYFKAVHFFFRFDWEEITEDVNFILEQYFPEEVFKPQTIMKHQYYEQCQIVAKHFKYQLWSKDFETLLFQQTELVLRKDISPQFIVMELLAFLREKKILRPAYTTLQTIISQALVTERNRRASLGIILCTGKTHEQIELLELDKSDIHVAEYITTLPPKAELQKKLHQSIEFARQMFVNKD